MTLIDTVQPEVGIFIDGVYEPNTSYLNSSRWRFLMGIGGDVLLGRLRGGAE